MRLPEYTVTQSPKAKNIRLKVTPESGLTVVIPRGYDANKIPAILRRKKDWIAEKLEQAAERRRYLEPALTDHLPDNLCLRALCREVRIVYRTDRKRPAGYWLHATQDELTITAACFSRRGVVFRLQEWLRITVREELFPLVRDIAARNRFAIEGLLVKSQRTRWASCSSRGNVSLNTKLLFLPPNLVRYVIVHELCHTVHMNHTPEFWRAVASYEPEYRASDNALRSAWKLIPGWLFPDRRHA